MPTKRTPKDRPPRSRVTPQAVELFARCQEIEASGKYGVWEENGGRHREYLDASVQLHRLLGLKLWEPDVLDAFDPEPPSWVRPSDRPSWQRAHELHQELSSRCAQS